MHVLIDGDIIVYRVGFACQKTQYWLGDKDLGTKKKKAREKAGDKWEDVTTQLIIEPITHCLHSVRRVIEDIIQDLKADSYTVFLTGKDNFRDKLVDYYKMNRKDVTKPHYYNDIRKYLMSMFESVMVEGEEADDAMSILHWTEHQRQKGKGVQEEYKTVIATIDKDLKNTPGWNYNFVTKEMMFIDLDQANLNFYAQLITGDMTDNIPGFFKITGSKAQASLIEPLVYADSPYEMYLIVLNAYVEEFGKWIDEDDVDTSLRALLAVRYKVQEVGQLLWMRRYKDERWTPPLLGVPNG